MAKQKKTVKTEQELNTKFLNALQKKCNAAIKQSNTVKSKSLASLAKWMDVGEEMVKSLVSDVKSIKKSVLQSDKKASVKSTVYVTTTPLVKCRVKTSELNAVYSQHKKRLKNIASLITALKGKKKGATK